jgi:ribonuclease P/MRP protein subunit RPP40
MHSVCCQARQFANMQIPIPTISTLSVSTPHAPVGDVEVWREKVMSLFEWAGMAALGAQRRVSRYHIVRMLTKHRLQANDRVDPYVAVYDPPTPSQIGSVTHLKWKGFLAPQFVQTVINTAMYAVHPKSGAGLTENRSSLAADPHPRNFMSITGHVIPTSPVSYIPPSLDSPLRIPRTSAEDTWSAILIPCRPTTPSPTAGVWINAESVGQWDRRLG